MKIFAIDPGSSLSGIVTYDKDAESQVKDPGKLDNLVVVDLIRSFAADFQEGKGVIVIEFPQPRGQLASKELFQMIFWVGRFYEIARAAGLPSSAVRFCDRKDVKMALCGSNSVKDKQIRQAIIDRFGGQDSLSGKICRACKGAGGRGRGAKRQYCGNCDGTGEVTPGELNTMNADSWQALAVAIMFDETGKHLDNIV